MTNILITLICIITYTLLISYISIKINLDNNFLDKNKKQFLPGRKVKTILGKIYIIESIDKDGYVKCKEQVSTKYYKHLEII